MKNLIKAVLAVMEECRTIEKGADVGKGNQSYKGVKDADVKEKFSASMRKNGLVIFPIEVNPSFEITSWEESNQWGAKHKQSVFTQVTTKYLLCHESGENVTLAGYGHGVDPQDKAAGKATTYALKYTLLYTFLTATGAIDDSDMTHSNDYAVPSNGAIQAPAYNPQQYQQPMQDQAQPQYQQPPQPQYQQQYQQPPQPQYQQPPQPQYQQAPQHDVKQNVFAQKRQMFIGMVAAEASTMNQTGMPTPNVAELINKAVKEYGATMQDIQSAILEAGVNIQLNVPL